MKSKIRVHRRQSPVSVLGPGRRAVIWVQGCSVGCRGCLIPESWSAAFGEDVLVTDLADWVLAQPEIEGITLSGGEPMEQAGALASLIEAIRAVSSLGVVCYTGYTLERLRARGTIDEARLLANVDLLIDGPYLEASHAPLLWRGSSNQRLIALTDRYRSRLPKTASQADSNAGLEFTTHADGSFSFAGVPAKQAFRSKFERLMLQRGVTWSGQKEGKA